MNQINFLPASFIAQLDKRSRLMRQGMLIALLVLGMLGGHLVLRQRGIYLRSQAEYLEKEARELEAQRMESARLSGLRQDMLRRVRLQQELVPPLLPSQLMTLIGQALPPSANLISLTLTDTTPAIPERKSVQTDSSARASIRKSVKADPVHAIQIMLVGLAPSDAEVADFYANLAALPVFVNVKLHYSRPTRAGSFSGREFRVELEAPLDRRIVPPQGVVHAH